MDNPVRSHTVLPTDVYCLVNRTTKMSSRNLIIVMLAFSALLTTKYIMDNPRYGGSIASSKDMDFVFLPRARI